ncbi:PPA1309 family protein [Aquipuribacter sp. SD81]|uniref:PPA1309 family protein n=1 Tax=Aquipuribacter sp. SD81 TaxID=3127703 RepID=UPI0030165E5D
MTAGADGPDGSDEPDGTRGPDGPGGPGGPHARGAALQRAVVEAESHVHRFGWDGPVRVFALVRTADALGREPGLAAELPSEDAAAADADPDHLLLVEQDGLDELADPADLEALLTRLAWPPDVDGVAVTVERVVVPPEVEAEAPAQEEAALRWLAEHPRRRDVRLAAGVLRDGSRACAVRARPAAEVAPGGERDGAAGAVADGAAGTGDGDVVTGPDLLPGLTRALAATLEE